MVSQEVIKKKIKALTEEFEEEFDLLDSMVPFAKQVATALITKGIKPSKLRLSAWNVLHEKTLYLLLIQLAERKDMTERELRNWFAMRGYNDMKMMKGLEAYNDVGIITLAMGNGAHWKGV